MPEILKKLKKGYQAFQYAYTSQRPALLKNLAEGQHPQVMVVACSDSRVDPAIVFQCDPGELFMVRNVANLVPTYKANHCCDSTSAALEYGVCHLHIPHLIIMGHSQCGGIAARLSDQDLNSDFIEDWVGPVNTDGCSADSVDCCAQKSLHQSYQNCLSFPWIKEQVDAGKLQIHRWFFDIGTGTILAYDSDADEFLPLC